MTHPIKSTIAILLLGLLCACGGGSGGSSNANAPIGTFGLVQEEKIAVAFQTATSDAGTVFFNTTADEQFWAKASPGDMRVFRYGRPGSGDPANLLIRRHNYRIPITTTTENGLTVNRGTLNVGVRSNLPTGTSDRDFEIEEIELENLIAGVIRIDELGSNFEGTDVHGYVGGLAASNLPNASTTYTGHFYGRILSDGGAVTSVDRPVTLTVDFVGGGVTGTLGPDVNLAGTLTGDQINGTATVASTDITLANGSTGTFVGGVFGDGAPDAGAAVAISDNGGAVAHELIGAFAGSQP